MRIPFKGGMPSPRSGSRRISTTPPRTGSQVRARYSAPKWYVISELAISGSAPVYDPAHPTLVPDAELRVVADFRPIPIVVVIVERAIAQPADVIPHPSPRCRDRKGERSEPWIDEGTARKSKLARGEIHFVRIGNDARFGLVSVTEAPREGDLPEKLAAVRDAEPRHGDASLKVPVPERGIEVRGIEDVEVANETPVVGGWKEVVAARVDASIDPLEAEHPPLGVAERGAEAAPPLHH